MPSRYCFFFRLLQPPRVGLFFTKIATPTIPSLLLHHRILYFLPLTSKNPAPSFLHLSSSRQHASTFLFFNSSYSSVSFPQKLPIFQLPNLISRFCNPEILRNPCPRKFKFLFWGLGANSFINFFMK